MCLKKPKNFRRIVFINLVFINGRTHGQTDPHIETLIQRCVDASKKVCILQRIPRKSGLKAGYLFLDASTHLYKRLCPSLQTHLYSNELVFRCVHASLYEGLSVGPSVRLSVHPSVGPSVGPLCVFFFNPRIQVNSGLFATIGLCIRPCQQHPRVSIRKYVGRSVCQSFCLSSVHN